MKKIILLALIGVVFATDVSAQLNGVLNRARNKAQQRADKKADEAIDAALDKAEGKSKPQPSAKNTEQPAAADAGTSSEATGNEPLKSYSRFDFIPGEKILYAEDFAQDEIGELPLQWNTAGKAEVVTLSSASGKWLRLFQNAVFLTSNKVEFSKNFTVEFDVILDMKRNGYTYPYFSFGFFSSKDQAPNDNQFLKEYDRFQSDEFFVRLSEGGATHASIETSQDRKRFFTTDQQNLAAMEKYYGKVAHIAIQVQESRTRIWFNGEKKFDLPMGSPTAYIFNNLFFRVHSSSYKDEQLGFYISNLKVATGKPDTRHKLLDEGKFSTTGILFDFQSAVIKPESYGAAKEIAVVLKENAALKLRITGHTSSDGDDKANMELSKKRAAAVRDLLVNEFGIDAARLSSDGKGETQPVADNNSKEGKVLNRRVEFTRE